MTMISLEPKTHRKINAQTLLSHLEFSCSVAMSLPGFVNANTWAADVETHQEAQCHAEIDDCLEG
jgi:hypothetical protein